ncbi:hypothetical protein [Kitasatospora sp. MBT63]|uniref:hypothetical protein n=1 Tax=Kitasatospora sp. MBT63 TaxID=1444768 RepID=UPI00053A982F|nr:hypothetical protein [Kitasatospora sp. MBT63]
MELTENRARAGGCARTVMWGLAAFVLATAGTLYGGARVSEAWHWCLTQDHEPDPTMAAASRSVWVVMLVVLVVLRAVVSDLVHSRWYVLLPVMCAATAVLTWLYVTGMGGPAPVPPGAPEEQACWTMPGFPFLG